MWKVLCSRVNLNRRHIDKQQLRTITQKLVHVLTSDPEKQTRIIKASNCCHYTPNQRHIRSFHQFTDTMDVPEGVFKGKIDRFNGITVDSKIEFLTENENFEQKLTKSLEHWITSQRRAIWFKVATVHSTWIPHLTQRGFEFHHAKTGYVMLYRWLPTSETANLPDFSHTMLGVGGLVINDNNEILVVSDRHAMIPNSWKLPGGYVDPKENLIDAAIREVREETGIECTFRTLVSFRHSHGGSFGCSDIYIVIALAPLHLNLTRCEREIAKLQWMPLDEYLQHPHVHQANNEVVRTYLDYQKHGISLTCKKAVHPVLNKEYMIYHVETPSATSSKEPINKST